MGLSNFAYITPGNATSDANVVAGPEFNTIPTMNNGLRPKYIRLSVIAGAIDNVIFVTPKTSATVGSAATGFPIPRFSSQAVILNVFGYTHLGLDQQGNGASSIIMTPLEDF